MVRLIFGCGYLGFRVAKLWKSSGDEVHAVTRSPGTADVFLKLGIQPIVADITKPETVSKLPEADTVLFAVGMDRSKYDKVRDVYVDGLSNVLAQLPSQTRQLIYVSSTGVYGDFGGEWVDESSKTEPVREGGIACLEAESLLKASQFGDRTSILRFAGIYGPDRVPTKALIQDKYWKKLSSNGYLNLVHVDDGAKIVQLIADQPPECETYLISDGHPPLRKDYYELIANHFGIDEIPWKESQVSPENNRSGSSKRISNEKFVKRFGYTFEFPDFKSGLAHALE